MKKLIAFITVCFISCTSFAQLTVIDQIAGTLLPKITDGINTIMSNQKKGKVDTAKVAELKQAYDKQVKELRQKMQLDENNIDQLNAIFLKTQNLLGPISSMKALCSSEMLTAIVNTHSQQLHVETLRLFKGYWSQFAKEIDNLSQLGSVGANAPLQTTLVAFSTDVKSSLNTLSSNLGTFPEINSAVKAEALEQYLTSLNNSSNRDEISTILEKIKTINNALSGYIKSFSYSLSTAQSSTN